MGRLIIEYAMSYDNQMVPAKCELHVTQNQAYCAVQYGSGLEEVVSAAHNEIKWAMDRGDVLVEQYDIISVDPR